MAAPIDVLFTQRFLSSGGFNPGKLDGRWGQNTNKAQEAFDAAFTKIAAEQGTFDPRSESKIHTLVPKAQIAARKVLNLAKTMPFTVKIGSGTRSCAEQNSLYAQGRSEPGHIVTNAQCGQSLHNFGIAWDVDIFVNGEYYDGSDKDPARARLEEKTYTDLANAVLAKIPGIDWGGQWKFVDNPHYQVATGGKTVTQLRELFEGGKPLV